MIHNITVETEVDTYGPVCGPNCGHLKKNDQFHIKYCVLFRERLSWDMFYLSPDSYTYRCKKCMDKAVDKTKPAKR